MTNSFTTDVDNNEDSPLESALLGHLQEYYDTPVSSLSKNKRFFESQDLEFIEDEYYKEGSD